MKWTQTPPSEPGWYWWRQSKTWPERYGSGAMPHCRWVTFQGGVLGVFNSGSWRTFEFLGGEWWPERIPEPEE